MKLLIYSDLHLEFAEYRPRKKVIEAADLIILAGDIAPGVMGVRWAKETFPAKRCIYIVGNHESYGFHWDEVRQAIKQEARHSNVTVLDDR